MRKLLITIFLINIAVYSFSDEWVSPTEQRIYSQNGLFCLVITPTFVPKDYQKMEEKIKKNPDKHVDKPKKDTIIPCHATLYHSTGNKNVLGESIWTEKLANPISPYSAFISNDGKYIVTFDDWGKLGYGDNVMVVYGESGNLLRKLSLNDIIPKQGIDLTKTVTSIWWYQGVETYSEIPEMITILIKDKNQNIIKRNFNLETLLFMD